MANPALKNGYISVANELVEKFATISISSSEMRIIWVVWRKTWGWSKGYRKKDWDIISISQFEKATGIKHANVVSYTKSLVSKRILLKGENGYKFNQNYDQWVVCKRIPQYANAYQGSMQTHTKTSMQTHTHKRKKETNKEISKTSVLHGKQWNDLIDGFKEVNPMYEDFYKNKTERNALEEMAKKWGFDKLKGTIVELPKIIGQPYAPKITKPSELRRDIGKLIAFYNQEKAKNKEAVKNYIL